MARLQLWLKKSQLAAQETKRQPVAFSIAEDSFAQGIWMVQEAAAAPQDPNQAEDRSISDSPAQVLLSLPGLCSAPSSLQRRPRQRAGYRLFRST